MKIYTTGWMSKQNIEFNSIMLVHYYGNSMNQNKDVVFSVSINEHPFKIAKFFKDASRFMKSKKVRDTVFKEDEHFQFVLANEEYDFFPVKWFTLELDNGKKISHDIANIAFATTLIKKNSLVVPLGGFSKRKSFSKHRESSINRNAYKFISNEVLKSYFDK